jgi:phage FluMu gp28-like protein
MGEMVVSVLQKEFGSSRIEGVLFNIASKENLAIAVRQGLERREFLLHNDERFHRQIHSIKRIPTSGGAFRYDSERDENGHADSFWAWCLANHAVIHTAKSGTGFYQQWREKREKKQEPAEEKKSPAVQSRGKSREQVLKDMLKANGG